MDGLAKAWTAQFDDVGKYVTKKLSESGVQAAFTEVDGRLMQVFKEMAVTDLKSGANLVFRNMSKDLISESIIGGNYNDLIKKIQGRLTAELLAAGEQIPVGQSLGAMSKRIGHDSLMNAYRGLQTKKAKDAGVTSYLYTGPSDKAIRDFCAERVDRVFTDEEIDSWNDLEYSGKIPGLDVRVVLGGYNCRHALQPLPPNISAADLGIEQEQGETE